MKAKELSLLRILPTPVSVSKPSDRASVEIYRPFFLAGMLCVLTVGCLLGAVALFGIGRAGSYTSSAWAPYILAHANSQLFGWVGFFIMGFALQQHAPTLARATLFHRLAWTSLLLMASGISLRFVAEPMVQANRNIWVPLGVFACLLQTAAVAIFLVNTSYTRHRSGSPLTWQTRFVFASLFWFFVVAVAEPFVFAHSHQSDRMASIQFIARWYPVLREAQFLGFVAMMIFGVSLVKLHSCFGVREANASLGKIGFFLWSGGLVIRMLGWLEAFNNSFTPGSQRLYFFGGALIATSGVLLLLASRIFEPVEKPQRAHKFVRGAYAWLAVAGLLVVLEPIHLFLINAPFSHAYTGAIRHAVTVGFISQMILGFGAHVTARMNDLDEKNLAPLWSVFVLLNIGNAARITLEIATDYSSGAFAPMGITGFIELIGLAIWAANVSRPMLARKRSFAYAK